MIADNSEAKADPRSSAGSYRTRVPRAWARGLVEQMELRVLMVHNFATHYTVKLFGCLATRVRLRVLFFSGGGEWYWLKKTRVQRELGVCHKYLRGVRLLGSRITPGLISEVLFGRYDVVIKCINGRFALPMTFLCAKLRGKPFVLYTGVWTRDRKSVV